VHTADVPPLHVKQDESQERQAPADTAFPEAKYLPVGQEVQSEDVGPLQVTQEESQVPQIPVFEGLIVVPVLQPHI